MINQLIRIVSWKGAIYIYRYSVLRVKERTHRIISSVPECVFQGMKQSRLGQFNQCYGGQERVLITIFEDYDRHKRFFLRKLKCRNPTIFEMPTLVQ